MMVSISKQYANSLKSSNRCKSFIEVNSFNLCVALSYKTSLIPHHLAIFGLFVAVDPLGTYDIVLARIWSLDKFPHIVELELMQFLLHCLNPLRLQKCLINFGGLYDREKAKCPQKLDKCEAFER